MRTCWAPTSTRLRSPRGASPNPLGPDLVLPARRSLVNGSAPDALPPAASPGWPAFAQRQILRVRLHGPPPLPQTRTACLWLVYRQEVGSIHLNSLLL